MPIKLLDFKKEKQYPIFVYGTLKKGLNNHRYLSGRYMEVREGVIKGEMYSLGYFPAIALEGSTQIIGEIYYINKKDFKQVLEDVDFLEGYKPTDIENSLYKRVLVDVTLLGGRTEKCYTYVAQKVDLSMYSKVDSGFWSGAVRGYTPTTESSALNKGLGELTVCIDRSIDYDLEIIERVRKFINELRDDSKPNIVGTVFRYKGDDIKISLDSENHTVFVRFV